MAPDQFKIVLVDPNVVLCLEFRDHFEPFENVSVVCGYFEALPEYDCMVSAANSFGLMDGGVDAAIRDYFGQPMVDRVQAHILAEYCGEQPVGTSFIIETGNQKHPFLAHTPTMRSPMSINETDNVYNAMWAMLVAIRNHNLASPNKIQVVACPGLGTATGRVSPRVAAQQMSLAYRHFANPPQQMDWIYAGERHAAVQRSLIELKSPRKKEA